MPLQVVGFDLGAFFAFPDITHHTATVALAVHVQDENWELDNHVVRIR